MDLCLVEDGVVVFLVQKPLLIVICKHELNGPVGLNAKLYHLPYGGKYVNSELWESGVKLKPHIVTILYI